MLWRSIFSASLVAVAVGYRILSPFTLHFDSRCKSLQVASSPLRMARMLSDVTEATGYVKPGDVNFPAGALFPFPFPFA